jgi:hypothetical protein
MVQRIQSLWLLLAAVFAFLTFKLPFYSGNKKDIVPPNIKLDSSSEIALLLLASVVIILCFVALVMFKNRKRQLTITIINTIFSIVLIIVYFLQIQKFDPGTGTLSLSSLFTLAIPLFLFLAARAIWKDEKLIKSLDRLR